MSNLTRRLRQHAEREILHAPLLYEAADEIDRLRAENKRLRDVLQHIAALERDFMSDPLLYAGVDHDKAKVARAALEDPK